MPVIFSGIPNAGLPLRNEFRPKTDLLFGELRKLPAATASVTTLPCRVHINLLHFKVKFHDTWHEI